MNKWKKNKKKIYIKKYIKLKDSLKSIKITL